MKPDASEPVKTALDEVRETLGAADTADQRSLEKATKHLPRSVRRPVSDVMKLERAAKYQPYLLDGQRKTIERAKKKVADYSQRETSKEDRKAARKRWYSGIALNYLVFLMLLAGFWYLGTRT